MKKVVFFFSISFFISNYTDGQQSLTNGGAYDLQVGDSILYRPVYWYDCQAGNPNVILTYYIYGEIIGFVVDSRQNLTDSIIYSVHLNQDSGNLVIKDLDSSVDKFTGLTGTFVSTNSGTFLGEANYGFGNVCCEPFYTCDSTAINCTIDSSISIVNGGKLFHFNYGFFEWGGSKSLLERCGLFERSADSNQGSFCTGGAAGFLPGGYNVNLAYYRSDSTTWIDSALFFYNDIPEIQSRQNTLSVYPNPTQSSITFETIGAAFKQITVTDVLGRTIYSAQTNSQSSIINLQSFPSGVYLIKASAAGGQDGSVTVKKFVKE